MNVGNASPTASRNDNSSNDGVQFASGGKPGMEMNGEPADAIAAADLETELSPTGTDFLMIQLSSFEGRADH